VDISAMIIRGLEKVGLAWDVVRIDRDMMDRKAESLARVGGGRAAPSAPDKPLAEKRKELAGVGIADVE
jgi:stearoyl-CoA desaturase (delta-9 desaturase)